jgi:hypothetical protein
MIGLHGHIILGMNLHPNTSPSSSSSSSSHPASLSPSHQFHPNETWFIDIHHQGKLITTFHEAMDFSSPYLPPADQLNVLLSSMSCEAILLRTLNNLIFVHHRDSFSHSLQFFAIMLSYLNTQILILFSPLALSTSLSPIPPSSSLTPWSCQWNTTNIAILQKFCMIAKDLKLLTILRKRLIDLEPYLPMVPYLQVLFQTFQSIDLGPS